MADQSIFNPVVIDNCDDDTPYNITLSAEIKTDISNAGQTFVDLRYANGVSLGFVDSGPIGRDENDTYILNPNQARLASGGSFGLTNVNVVTNLGVFFKQSINVWDPPTLTLDLSTLYCSDIDPFQITASVDGVEDSDASGHLPYHWITVLGVLMEVLMLTVTLIFPIPTSHLMDQELILLDTFLTPVMTIMAVTILYLPRLS